MSRAIVFDLIGTLLDLGAMDNLFERFFGDANVRKEWFMQTMQLAMVSMLTDTYEDFRVQADTGLEMTARRYKVSMLGEEKNLILGTLRKLRAYPDVVQNLQKMRDAGLKLAILTNTTLEIAEAQLTFAGLKDYFDQVISTDEISRFKPDPEVYRLAARHLGLETSELRLVTAHDWDVTGAVKAGCVAAFVARPGLVLNPFGPQPDLKGSDLSDVTEKILAVELEQDKGN